MSEKNYEKMCCYCEFASPTYDKDEFLCTKKGVVDASYKCRKFVYDPMKRAPRNRPETDTVEYVDI